MRLTAPLHRPHGLRVACPRVLQVGFTLIELMVAVAIVSVIAAVAYPSYADYVTRGRLAEAPGELSLARVRLEQYFQDNRNYGSTSTACGISMPTGTYFTYACTWGSTGTSQSFVMTATGRSTANMAGYTYTVNQNNLQQTTAFVGATGLPANCWIRRKGDVC